MSTSHVIGATAGHRVKAELSKPSPTPPHTRTVLVRTLGRDEVMHLISSIEDFRVEGCEEPVEVVVSLNQHRRASDGELGRFGTDRTLTYFRNRASRGLVLIELDPFSDVSGQRHLRTISDRDLMGSPGEPRWRDELIRHAWSAQEPAGEPPPAVLTDRLGLLAEALVAGEMALRPWTAFVLKVLAGARAAGVVTAHEAERLISDALPALGLFRDPDLFAHRNLQRELSNNRHVAQLRDPSGRDLEQEDWLRRIEAADFGASHNDLDASLVEARRHAARSYILRRSEENRVAAPQYSDWMRLFDAKANRGLGEQIRAELARQGGLALERFEELDLGADLDAKDREAAQRLLDDDADVGEGRTVAEVVPAVLRRRLERLATPGTLKVSEPLRGILQAVHSLAGDDGARVELRFMDPEPPAGTRHVFALLFGPTLVEVAQKSEARLALDKDLLRLTGMPPTEEAMEAQGLETDVEPWSELRLSLTTTDGESAVNLSWDPGGLGGYALLGRLIERPRLRFPLEVEAFDSLADVTLPFDGEEDQTTLDGWLEKRQAFLVHCAERGLSHARIDEYATEWERCASELKALVDARPDLRASATSDFLDVDLLHVAGGEEIWMLGTHPLRLRWFARDLQELEKHLVSALRGELTLNPENSTLFTTWLERVSPHRQPPMLCSDDWNYLPAKEVNLHEQYVRTEVRRESVGERMDSKTINELLATVETYLNSFPAKVDRFVLLLLTRSGDTELVEQLLRRLLVERRAVGGRQQVDLHLVSPLRHHGRLTAAAARIPVGDSGSLIPRLRTIMHPWPEQGLPDLEDLADDVDVAIVPEVLGSSATLHDGVASRNNSFSRFDPWMDKPVHVPVQARHQTDVTVELLPGERDGALETWSTLNVRRRRTAVGTGSDDIDRVSLAVQVQRGLNLFRRLHDIAQWVVTVDEFVGREQIDAIPDPPDVIFVRPRRGKNELYTLVVSSRAGRDFVERGLRRKLAAMDLHLHGLDMGRLTSRLYDLARNTAPSVVLRAVGLGRALEEILGLVTTRVLVDQVRPAPPGVGADWWISLDDHTDWFGGAIKSRADLARVSLREGVGGAELQVDVVESKFRQDDDADQAVRQVLRTVRILDAGLDSTQERADSRFWREELARAIDGVSRRPTSPGDMPGFRAVGHPTDMQLDKLWHDLREGYYRLTLNGLACAVALSSQGEFRASEQHGVHVLHVPGRAARAVLTALARDEAQPAVPTLADDQGSRAATPAELSVARIEAAPVVLGAPEVLHVVAVEQAVEPQEADHQITSSRGKLSAKDLRQRLQKVINKLDEFRVSVEVPGEEPFGEGPGFYLLRVVPGRGVRVQQIQQRVEDLQLALGLEMDQAIRTYAHRGAVVLEVPKHDEERYPVSAKEIWDRVPPDPERLLVPVGEDITGDTVSIDLSSPNSPHLLVAGMTGSGKSVALETILRGACRYQHEQLKILAIDPKGTELRFLESFPHLLGQVGLTPSDASQVLEQGLAEMDRRYSLMSATRVSNIGDYNSKSPAERLPWWIIVLDEYADLAIDPDDRKKVEPGMLRLAQKARAAGIHLVIATQRPSADILNTSVRANFPAQLALRVRSGVESNIIIGEAGAEALAGKGDALLRTGEGVKRLQCASSRA